MIMGCKKRRKTGKLLMGVCSGLSHHTGINVWKIRAVFAVACVPFTVFTPLTYGICAYTWDKWDDGEWFDDILRKYKKESEDE